MPRFQISDNNETTNNYLTPMQGDNRYYNMQQDEKLQKDLDINGNKILNPSDDSDVITKTQAEITYAKPLRELIVSNKQLVIDNKLVLDNLHEDVDKNDRKVNSINSQLTTDISEINETLSSKIDKSVAVVK